MRVVRLVLSGDEGISRAVIERHWPGAEIIPFDRSIIDRGTRFSSIAALRRLRPIIFAVVTESLEWQYGQDLLLLFGALAGARISMIVDSQRRFRKIGRARLLTISAIRIVGSYLQGRQAVAKAKSKLREYERIKIPTVHGKPDKPMTIAYLRTTPSAGTVPGGAASHITGVVNALLDHGVFVNFISNDDVAGIEKLPLSFQKLGPVSAVMPRAAFDIYNGSRFSERALRSIEKVRPSFIYERYSRFSFAGAEAHIRLGIPFFLEYNGSEVWAGRHWDHTALLGLLQRYERFNLRSATRIFVVSQVEKKNLLDAGVDERKIVVNPNGVDTNTFRPGIGGHVFRDELGVDESVVLVGFLGTFGPWHGVVALADAIALTPKNTNLRFLMIGDGSLRKEVEARLRTSGHLERVIFTGSVDHERVPAMLDACDILIAPHVPLAGGMEFFGSPTKLYEYMAMGKGIVASRLGQIGEVLENNVSALLVEPGNADELSVAIRRLAESRPLRERLGTAARDAVERWHTWRHNARRVLDAFEELSRSKD